MRPAKADIETRTRNLILTKDARCLLRHASEVPPEGFEPSSHRLKGETLDHLSYGGEVDHLGFEPRTNRI